MAKTLIILAEGFEEIEAITVIDILRRADIEVIIAGLHKQTVKGTHGITIQADMTLNESLQMKNTIEMLILPGGLPGAHNLRDDNRVIELVQYLQMQNKFTAAICAAPIVLAKAGVLANKKATCYPGHLEALNDPTIQLLNETVVTDNKVVTSRGPATAMAFGLELVRLLKGEPHSKSLAEKMLVT